MFFILIIQSRIYQLVSSTLCWISLRNLLGPTLGFSWALRLTASLTLILALIFTNSDPWLVCVALAGRVIMTFFSLFVTTRALHCKNTLNKSLVRFYIFLGVSITILINKPHRWSTSIVILCCLKHVRLPKFKNFSPGNLRF